MDSFLLKIKKIVSSFLIISLCQMTVSPIFLNQMYAAATLSVSAEVPTPTNIVTPSYSFVSDTNGTIIY